MDIEAAGERGGKVVWPETDHIDAFHIQDVVKLVQGALGLDLRTGDSPAIGLRKILPWDVELGAIGAPAPGSAWRIFDRAYEAFGILGRIDQGAHDALGAPVEGAPD